MLFDYYYIYNYYIDIQQSNSLVLGDKTNVVWDFMEYKIQMQQN